jgi:hypothetical protein
MDEYDNTTLPQPQSVTERQLRRLVVPAPAAYEPNKRVDRIQKPSLDLLWGDPE